MKAGPSPGTGRAFLWSVYGTTAIAEGKSIFLSLSSVPNLPDLLQVAIVRPWSWSAISSWPRGRTPQDGMSEMSMSIPKYHELYRNVLEALSDGEIHSNKDICAHIAREMKLSEEDMALRLPSGGNLFANRVGWSLWYLSKAGVVDKERRGRYRITGSGKQLFQSGKRITNEFWWKTFQNLPGFSAGTMVRMSSPGSSRCHPASLSMKIIPRRR